MVDSRELIRAIVDEDFVSAKEMTNDLLFATTGEVLDVVRQDVAANLFGDAEVNEGQMSVNRYGGGKKFNWNKPHGSHPLATADYDKDGTVEPPKAEVLGSRINAAVKSGRLSPMQASRTKNPGQYR